MLLESIEFRHMRSHKFRLIALITLVITLVMSNLQTPIPWLLKLPPAAAQQIERQPLTLYEPVQNFEWAGPATSPKGLNYFPVAGIHTDWTHVYDTEIESARQNGDRYREAEALFRVGLSHHAFNGSFDKARDYYEQDLELIKTPPSIDIPGLETALLGNLALTYLQQGHYQREAFDVLDKQWSRTWHKSYYYAGDDPKLGGMTLANRGNAYFGADLYVEAVETHQQHLKLAREIRDRKGEAQAYGNLGMVYQAIGDYPQAIENQKQRLKISRRINDKAGEGLALSNLGIIYHSQGNYAQAIDAQQKFLVIARDLKNRPWEEQALSNLAGGYYFLGDYAKAIQLNEQALDIAWDLGEAQLAAKIRNNLGLIYFQQGKDQKAIEFYRRFLASAYQRDSRRGEAVARNNIAVAYFRVGEKERAIKNLRLGIERLESLNERIGDNDAYKVSLFETQTALYTNLQLFLIDQGDTNGALEVAERGRARAFIDLLAQKRTFHPKQKQTLTPPTSPLTIDHIQTIAKTHEQTLVEYSIAPEIIKVNQQLQTRDSQLLIWVIQPSGKITMRQVDLTQETTNSVENLVIESQAALGVRGEIALRLINAPVAQKTVHIQLQQLYTLLIAPITDLLPDNPQQTVVFIPHRSLFLTPFAALEDTEGNYLIEKYPLLSAPSIQVMDLIGESSPAPSPDNNAVVVGNPSMPPLPKLWGGPDQTLSPLPGAEQEAETIAQLLNADAMLGEQATETKLKQRLPKASLIHLATHGLLDDARGLGSAIALTPTTTDDGFLTAEEILEFKLKAKLVVLSACNSGRGKITGDGVIGLSRSFLSAGAQSILVSLWSVPDAPTAELMTQFYQESQQNPNKAIALQKAMQATLKQFPTPKDWAAFTLIDPAI